MEASSQSGNRNEQEKLLSGSAVWECNMCLAELRDPVCTTCGHLFCWPCLFPWVRDMAKPCPVCRSTLLTRYANIIAIYNVAAGEESQAPSSAEAPTVVDNDRIPPRPRPTSMLQPPSINSSVEQSVQAASPEGMADRRHAFQREFTGHERRGRRRRRIRTLDLEVDLHPTDSDFVPASAIMNGTAPPDPPSALPNNNLGAHEVLVPMNRAALHPHAVHIPGPLTSLINQPSALLPTPSNNLEDEVATFGRLVYSLQMEQERARGQYESQVMRYQDSVNQIEAEISELRGQNHILRTQVASFMRNGPSENGSTQQAHNLNQSPHHFERSILVHRMAPWRRQRQEMERESSNGGQQGDPAASLDLTIATRNSNGTVDMQS